MQKIKLLLYVTLTIFIFCVLFILAKNYLEDYGKEKRFDSIINEKKNLGIELKCSQEKDYESYDLYINCYTTGNGKVFTGFGERNKILDKDKLTKLIAEKALSLYKAESIKDSTCQSYEVETKAPSISNQISCYVKIKEDKYLIAIYKDTDFKKEKSDFIIVFSLQDKKDPKTIFEYVNFLEQKSGKFVKDNAKKIIIYSFIKTVNAEGDGFGGANDASYCLSNCGSEGAWFTCSDINKTEVVTQSQCPAPVICNSGQIKKVRTLYSCSVVYWWPGGYDEYNYYYPPGYWYWGNGVIGPYEQNNCSLNMRTDVSGGFYMNTKLEEYCEEIPAPIVNIRFE